VLRCSILPYLCCTTVLCGMFLIIRHAHCVCCTTVPCCSTRGTTWQRPAGKTWHIVSSAVTSVTHTYTHTCSHARLATIFSEHGQPVDSRIFLHFSLTPSCHIFLRHPVFLVLSVSIVVQSLVQSVLALHSTCPKFGPISVSFTFHMSKPSQSTVLSDSSLISVSSFDFRTFLSCHIHTFQFCLT